MKKQQFIFQPCIFPPVCSGIIVTVQPCIFLPAVSVQEASGVRSMKIQTEKCL